MKRALVVRGGWGGHEPFECTDVFIPFLKENVYIPQLRRWFESVPGRDDPLTTLYDLPFEIAPVDHRALLANQQFPNVLEYRLWSQEDVLNGLDQAETHLQNTLSFIRQALE